VRRWILAANGFWRSSLNRRGALPSTPPRGGVGNTAAASDVRKREEGVLAAASLYDVVVQVRDD